MLLKYFHSKKMEIFKSPVSMEFALPSFSRLGSAPNIQICPQNILHHLNAKTF